MSQPLFGPSEVQNVVATINNICFSRSHSLLNFLSPRVTFLPESALKLVSCMVTIMYLNVNVGDENLVDGNTLPLH